jgi:RNA polymerase sigma-70 factor (ECF subfamily)
VGRYSSTSPEELFRICSTSADVEVWEEFVQRFHGVIAAVVIRATSQWGPSSEALVDDLIQEVYLKICAERKSLLGEFTPIHPEAFYGYLKVIATNVVRDYFRAQQAQKRGSGQVESATEDQISLIREEGAKPAEEDAHRNVLLREVEQALCSVASSQDTKRDRAIFFLYYRYGLTASAIAHLPSISLTVKGVESVIHRLTQLVREKLTERDNALSSD